jgi:hypothetical protein
MDSLFNIALEVFARAVSKHDYKCGTGFFPRTKSF